MSGRLDRAEAILLAVAEQTAANSRAITVINQTLQTLLEDRIEIYNILESLARDIAQLRDVSEQQNWAITYLISKD